MRPGQCALSGVCHLGHQRGSVLAPNPALAAQGCGSVLRAGSAIWGLGGATLVCDRGALRMCAIPIHQGLIWLSLWLVCVSRFSRHCYKCLFIALSRFPDQQSITHI